MTEQWRFTPFELLDTPSSKDGISTVEERQLRSKGCSFIIAIGIQLKLPQTCLATACVIFHRFYQRNSFRKFHFYDTGATCIFLASKIEDCGRRLRDVVIQCAKIVSKGKDQIDEQSKVYWRWRDAISYQEEVVLESICFDLTFEHPYTSLQSLLLNLAPESKDFARIAWGFVNDCIRTVVCLLYSPQDTSATAFYYAAKKLEITDLLKPEAEWWSKNGNVKLKTIEDILKIMQQTYENSFAETDKKS